ncbi:MAG: methylglyoxal synthase [Candidatus Neomarinimicrobiota bacterium]
MKTLAIIAHDARKQDALEWAVFNKDTLAKFNLVGTKGTSEAVNNVTGLQIKALGHGPDGGDIVIASEVLQGKIDMVFFLIDARTPHGHEHDIQTLIRICVLKNIPLALNRKSADYLISSVMMENVRRKS